MGTKLAGKSGDVYVANVLLASCETIWSDGTKGVAALDTTYVKVGDGSAKCTLAATPGTEAVAMYQTIVGGAVNVSAYNHILLWAYSVPTTEAGDYRISLGTAAAAATPLTYVTLPILTANTWKYCHCDDVTSFKMSASTASTIIGLYTWANGAENDVIYLDDIRAAKVIAGINSWNVDYVSDALETTDFVSAGARSYIAGPSGWSGSFSGYKDGAPLSIGSLYGLGLAESATLTQMWLGDAIITGVHPSTGFDGVVSYSYDFQGSGVLTVASA